MMASQPVRPSETQDFIRCPRYWYWKHVEGWEPPVSAWTPDRAMGSAVHNGLHVYWQGRAEGEDHPIGVAEGVGIMLDHVWPEDAPPEFSKEASHDLALRVTEAVIKWIAKEMPDAKPVMVEQALGEDGHTTPDLVTREEGDILAVTDWKTSWNVPADRVQYRLQGAYRDHQFLHYCWAVGQHLGEPVSLFRKVVIVGSPKIIIKDVTFTPSPEAIEYWLTGARQVWSDMAQIRVGERVPSQNVNGCKMYGDKYPCPMYDACWTCHGDPTKMTQFLKRSPR